MLEERDTADHEPTAAPDRGELYVPDDDIRERSAPDPTERVDPRERRRVPIPDETTATVERARIAAAEVQQDGQMTADNAREALRRQA